MKAGGIVVSILTLIAGFSVALMALKAPGKTSSFFAAGATGLSGLTNTLEGRNG